MGHATAAILVIGDEILSGRTREANAHHAAQRLFARGCRLLEIAIVPDDKPAIIEALCRLRQRAEAVITSGGIGPTHDDITMEAVAEALGKALVPHPETIARLKERYGDEIGMRMRMAQLPEGAEPIICERTFLPGAAVDGVYVLAGVPEIFASQLEAILPRFGTREGFVRAELEVQLPESLYAEALGEIQRRFSDVHIGSYPKRCGPKPLASICLEAASSQRLEEALEAVRAMVDSLKGVR